MKKIFLAVTALMMSISLIGNLSIVSAADAKNSVCEGIGIANNDQGCAEPTDSPSVTNVIRAAVTILSYVAGVAAVLTVMVGGFKYITSGGDSNKVSSAKNTILYALIGAIVAILAQVLVHFVINRATSLPPDPPTPASPGTYTCSDGRKVNKIGTIPKYELCDEAPEPYSPDGTWRCKDGRTVRRRGTMPAFELCGE